MRVFFRCVFILAGLIAAAALAVHLYFLPFPEPPEEEVDYREVVRFIDFSSADPLKEWEEKSFARIKTDYFVDSSEEKTFLRAVSENSSSAMYLRERLSWQDRPYAKWDWKVIKFPEREGEETIDSRNEFDLAAHFYVLFHSRFIMNTRAIQYVWVEHLPEGTWAVNPYARNLRIKVLRSGDPGEWRTEERDIAADYLELFGEELDRDVVAIAFMSDSDNTESSAEALLANIELGYLPLPEEIEDLSLEPNGQ